MLRSDPVSSVSFDPVSFYATLIDSSKRWLGVRMSVEIMQELDKLRALVMPRTYKSEPAQVMEEKLIGV